MPDRQRRDVPDYIVRDVSVKVFVAVVGRVSALPHEPHRTVTVRFVCRRHQGDDETARRA